MKHTAWGRFPIINAAPFFFNQGIIPAQLAAQNQALIPVGNLRSYGDSALANRYIPMRRQDRLRSFDPETGRLECESGVLLSEIIETFLPRGWFLKITPGTKLITVGGAIASDVHGKNHHVEGCFSECVEKVRVLLPDGTVQTCARGDDLFHATCGGMGLTGVIVDATIFLKKVHSQNINQTCIKTHNLKETFAAFEAYSDRPYSVAWIDCLAQGGEIGKCLLMVGDFAHDGDLNYKEKKRISVPFEIPSFALNNQSVKLFNQIYYRKEKEGTSSNKVGIDSFFYPLDAINHWNRIYGKNGFTQYQCIFPKTASFEGLSEILTTIAESGKGSFLAVLKLYGPANENYLSFPMEGYSLALDFKIEKTIFHLLDQLDKIVILYGGRLYLTKDVRVSKETFEAGYPQIERFRSYRKKMGMDKVFNSIQSQRLGL